LNHDNVSVFDAETLRLEYRIDVPGIVVESAISPDGNTLYVSNFRRDSVQFIDVASHAVTREVHAGRHPKIVVLSRDGLRLFAANWASEDVTEIDTRTGTVTRTLRAQENPRGMAITRGGRLYIANSTSDSIDVYEGADMSTHTRLDNVCRVPRHITLSPDDSRLYVSCLGGGFLAVMDTSTHRVVRRVFVASGPKANDVSPDGRYIATADYNASSVSVIDTTDWRVRTIEVPTMDRASGIVFARDGFRIFVTGWFDNHLFAVGNVVQGTPYRPSAHDIEMTRARRIEHDSRSGEPMRARRE
jgi:YVTN family beta-propeller protein